MSACVPCNAIRSAINVPLRRLGLPQMPMVQLRTAPARPAPVVQQRVNPAWPKRGQS
jgi:hypothetical protein